MTKSEILPLLFLPLLVGLVSCSHENSTRLDYQMGEKIPLGPLTYNIVQNSVEERIRRRVQDTIASTALPSDYDFRDERWRQGNRAAAVESGERARTDHHRV